MIACIINKLKAVILSLLKVEDLNFKEADDSQTGKAYTELSKEQFMLCESI